MGTIYVIRKILVSIEHCPLVPLTYTNVIGFRQIKITLRGDAHQGRGVIHDRGTILGAGREVVLETERVPNLMCRQLANSCERHLQHFRRHRLAIVRGQQAFGDQVVLPNA